MLYIKLLSKNSSTIVILLRIMEPEVYNMIALGGLLLGKLVLFAIIIYFCCRNRRLENSRTDSADQTDDLQ